MLSARHHCDLCPSTLTHFNQHCRVTLTLTLTLALNLALPLDMSQTLTVLL